MIDGHACKVITVSVSKTGKHGDSKVRFDFDGPGENGAVYRTEAEVEIIPC